jgi:hypothetical protein
VEILNKRTVVFKFINLFLKIFQNYVKVCDIGRKEKLQNLSYKNLLTRNFFSNFRKIKGSKKKLVVRISKLLFNFVKFEGRKYIFKDFFEIISIT